MSKLDSQNSTVHVYSVGLMAASVCAPSNMAPDEVVAAVNEAEPTGINSPWQLSSDPTFRQGGPNPGPCDQDPARTHHLLEC